MGEVSIPAAADGGDPPARGRSDGLRDHSGESQDVHRRLRRRRLRRSHRGGGGAIAGAVIGGALLGGAAGNMLDQRDKRMAAEAQQKALESAPTGTPVAWNNPDNGHSGTITPTQTYQSGGTYCREFQSDVVIDGKPDKAWGTACRQPDGSWKVQG